MTIREDQELTLSEFVADWQAIVFELLEEDGMPLRLDHLWISLVDGYGMDRHAYAALIRELHRRGHLVFTLADGRTPCEMPEDLEGLRATDWDGVLVHHP